MSTRISSAAGLLLLLPALVGCDRPVPEVEDIVATAAPEDRIECAEPGSDRFAVACVRERQGDLLTLRRSNGGFHRLRMTDDGRGVIAADGAEPARISIIADNRIEVAIGGARYRLPATVAPVAAAR